jgi:hypothetical protein
MISRIPIGTLTKKIPRQDQYATNRPPKIGPIIEPIGKMLPKSPTALSRASPKLSVMIAVADGVKPAPPAAEPLGELPGQRAHEQGHRHDREDRDARRGRVARTG